MMDMGDGKRDDTAQSLRQDYLEFPARVLA